MAGFNVTELNADLDFGSLPYWDVVIIDAGPFGAQPRVRRGGVDKRGPARTRDNARPAMAERGIRVPANNRVGFGAKPHVSYRL